MKQLLVIVIAILSVSCTHYVQLFTTKTTSPMKLDKDGAYTYENDTVKIVYTFWADRGELSYTVFNKLDIPIYIDWKKSSYVKNSDKLDYYIDAATTNGVTKGHGTAVYGTVYGKSYNNSTTIKPEQIVFIAPKSTITKDQFILLTGVKLNFDNSSVEVVKRSDNPKKTAKIKYIEYTPENSILVFRNFLTFSTSDKFDKESYVDNGFYISKATEMDQTNFWGGKIAKTEYWRNRNAVKSVSFQSPRNFYIDLK